MAFTFGGQMPGLKVFLSFSGERSKTVAGWLKEWLPGVIQSVEPFLSEVDIDAGEVWISRLDRTLGEHDYGILCVTPENVANPWLLFEAGALHRAGMLRPGPEARAVPYLIGGVVPDLRSPLGLLQGASADEAGTFKMVGSMYHACQAKGLVSTAFSETRLVETFRHQWPLLDNRLRTLTSAEGTGAVRAEPEVSAVLRELYGAVVGLSARFDRLEGRNSPAPESLRVYPYSGEDAVRDVPDDPSRGR